MSLLKNNEEVDDYSLINEAYKIERLDSKIKGGWQDYLSSIYGGFNWIDLYQSNFFINRLRVDKKTELELENNLLLIKFGKRKSSSLIQAKKLLSYKKNPKSKKIYFNKMRNLSIHMKNFLINGDLDKFGESMDRSWFLKKQLNSNSSNKKLDKFYNIAKKNGVLGGKILGAGQSGYLLIYVNSIYQSKLIAKLKKVNSSIKIERASFSSDGLKYWKMF